MPGKQGIVSTTAGFALETISIREGVRIHETGDGIVCCSPFPAWPMRRKFAQPYGVRAKMAKCMAAQQKRKRGRQTVTNTCKHAGMVQMCGRACMFMHLFGDGPAAEPMLIAKKGESPAAFPKALCGKEGRPRRTGEGVPFVRFVRSAHGMIYTKFMCFFRMNTLISSLPYL